MSGIEHPLQIVVGAGGVGKTTLAAAMALKHARAGERTMVMTFDPSLRLKDALGISEAEASEEVEVPVEGEGSLLVSLLDARRTFDRLVRNYAPNEEARERILSNRFYDHLSGALAGVLEYMASERLFEVSRSGRFDRIILDTPPAQQAIDFLKAPERITGFLDSGGVRIALKPWFDAKGRLRGTAKLGFLGRNVEAFFDHMIGLDLLRDMAEFFQAFAPLFDGFKQRAFEVQRLLRAPDTLFSMVSAPGPHRVADTLHFARRLEEAGHRLGPVIVNRVHPLPEGPVKATGGTREGVALLQWLAQREAEGIEALEDLLAGHHPVIRIPLLPEEPTNLDSLASLGEMISESFR